MQNVKGADFAGSLRMLSPGHGATRLGPCGVAETPANMRQEPLPETHPRHVRKKPDVLQGSDAIRFCLKHGISMVELEGKVYAHFDPETAKTTTLSFVDCRKSRAPFVKGGT